MFLKFFKKKEEKKPELKVFSYTIYKTDGSSIDALEYIESESKLSNFLVNSLEYNNTLWVVDQDDKRFILKTKDIKEIVINGEIWLLNLKFELKDGRIFLIVEINIWDGVVERRDVTDDLYPIIGEYLNQPYAHDYQELAEIRKTLRGEI